MKVTAIVENTSTTGLATEHGLSLYIQLKDGQKILFDMGQKELFAENAERLGLSIADVDTAIISHGHYDHGGGLGMFLELNNKATVYIHKDAFQPHYSLRENGLTYIGLEKELEANKRLAMCENIMKINEKITLFSDIKEKRCYPLGNRLLFGPQETRNDTFSHEQNLVIEENGNVILFAGCAHNGIVNIIKKATEATQKTPTHIFAGMHLVKSGLSEEEENKYIAELAEELMSYKNCKYYTMHCTGTEQYNKLKAIMREQIEYLSCGESIRTDININSRH